jgi:hypothetical protein
MKSSRRLAVVITAAMLLVLAACAPEGQRELGGGAGGDIGNWSDPVRMHGEDDMETRIFYETPRMGLGIERSQDARGDDSES